MNDIELKIQQRRIERDRADLMSMLSNQSGRRFIWRIFTIGRTFQSSYTGNSQTFFNEGCRYFSTLIFDEIMREKPDAFVQMQRESVKEQREDQALRDKAKERESN